MRRTAPRPLRPAIESVMAAAAPATPLASVQRAWREAAGERVAVEARPVSERAGTVTVECTSAVWAQELELLSRDLLERLRAALPEGVSVTRLRFVAGGRRPPP